MQRLLPVVVVAVLLNAGWARTAHATPIDVQFSGTYSYICGYPCPYVAPVQNGPGLIGQAGDRWNWFAASSAANQPLQDASGQTTSVTMTFSADGAFTADPDFDAFHGSPWANLMQGYLYNHVSISLFGLMAGATYDLYVYTQGDSNSAGRVVGLQATGTETDYSVQVNATAFFEKNNYLHLRPVADATGRIDIVNTYIGGESDVNGFQLELASLPEPSALGLLTAMSIGLASLRGGPLRRAG